MGAGALGMSFGGFLAKARDADGKRSHDVTLVGREMYLAPVKTEGLTITGILGGHKVKGLKAVTDIKTPAAEYDLILLTTKAFDTEKAMRQIKPLIGDAYVLSLQNGIGNEEIIAKYTDKVLGGMVIIGFEIAGPAHTRVTVFADNVKIGRLDNRVDKELKEIVEIFNDAEIPTDAVGNIQRHIW